MPLATHCGKLVVIVEVIRTKFFFQQLASQWFQLLISSGNVSRNLSRDGVARRNISNTRKSVSSDIQTLGSELKKPDAAEFFFNQLRCAWISD